MANWWGLLLLIGLAWGQGPEKRRTANVCNIDMDCPDNAFCRQSSYCVCKNGYVYAAVNTTHKECLREATIGDACVQNIQCNSLLGVHSECVSGVCECKGQAHLEGSRCYETAMIGDRCVSDENCYLGDRMLPEFQAYCVRGYCSCQLLYSPRDSGSRCVKDANLDEVCEDALQCAGAGLECQGTCRCRGGWVAHNYTRGCLESVKSLNEPCDYDVQCGGLAGAPGAPSPGAALCLGGVCTCDYSARAAGEPLRCWHKKRPGHDCRRDEECVSEEDEPGYCLNGRCTCKTCKPDARDFSGTAPTSPPLFIAAILVLCAILRY